MICNIEVNRPVVQRANKKSQHFYKTGWYLSVFPFVLLEGM